MRTTLDRLLSEYRRLGADLPFGDPLLGHGIGMEGYYWRLSDAASGRVVVALCGVCRDDRGETWAAVALAAHPWGVVAQRAVGPAVADPARFGARAEGVFEGAADRLRVDLGGEGRLDVRFSQPVRWPARAWGALGPAHWLPGLRQYWHPHVLGGLATGEVTVGGERVSIDGWRVYAEKNWGSAFPGRWWWGQAHHFGPSGDDDVCLAFAGGALGGGMSATGVVVRVGSEVVRLAAPTAWVRARVDGRRWWLAGRSPRWAVTIDGATSGAPCALPVPVPGERRVEPRAAQDLAGTVRLSVRRGRRPVFTGESRIAGLEYGAPPGEGAG